MIAYFNGQFLPLEEIHVSPFDRGFLFADGVYEALTSYSGKLFLCKEHLERLQQSLSAVKINYSGIENLENTFYELMRRNNLQDAVIYLQITRGAHYPRMHAFPPADTESTIFISASPKPVQALPNNIGVKVILENDIRWDRCDIKSLMLLPSVMAKQKAAEQNAYEAVWVRNGYLKEGAHTNIFAVKEGRLYTPPLSNTILPGITRQFIIKISKQNNIDVIEEELKLDDLNSFEEIFLTGTTTEIKPVGQVNDVLIGDTNAGKLTDIIQKLFNESVL